MTDSTAFFFEVVLDSGASLTGVPYAVLDGRLAPPGSPEALQGVLFIAGEDDGPQPTGTETDSLHQAAEITVARSDDASKRGSGEVTVFRADLFDQYLEDNPYALLEVPCNQIPAWVSVANYTPPASVMNRLTDLQNNNRSFWETYIEGADWRVQELSEANGAVVNMDYFPVHVSELPDSMSAQALFEHIRANMTTTDSTGFLNKDLAELEIYPDLPNEDSLWLSTNPLSAILSFQMKYYATGTNINDGSVITSDYERGASASQWKFTTIRTPEDWRHPVTGNREFGFIQNGDGSYTFYTRGVDRVTSLADKVFQLGINTLGELTGREGLDLVFNTGSLLWYNFQDRIVNHVEANGGSAANGSTLPNNKYSGS